MAYTSLDVEMQLRDLIDSVNIADDLDDESLAIIGGTVVEYYDKDLESRKDWDEKMEKAVELALQVTEHKTFPWEGAANVKYPLLTTAAIQFASRAYPAIVPGPNLVQGKVTGYDPDGAKLDKAQRIGKHMSYQIMEEMDDWEDDQDRLLLTLPIMGSAFKKTYRDNITNKNVSEIVYPWDLVFDYWAKSVEKATRKTHKINMIPNDLIARFRQGIFREVELADNTDREDRPLAQEVEGLDQTSDEQAPRLILEQYCYWDLDGDGFAEPYIISVDHKTREVLRIVANFTSEDIMWSEDGEIVNITPTEYFTQYIFVPDPNGGNMGLGFGTLLGPINESVNTLINQLLDAGTLSNLQSGYIGSGIRIRQGENRFDPGEWKVVRTTGVDIKNNIVPLPVRDPSQVLFLLLQQLVESGEKLSSVTDNLVGDNPPANQPATTTLALIEQGLKVFTSIYKRVYRSMTKEFKKLYRLNADYLSDEEYFALLDVPEPQMTKISRGDYLTGDLDVSPTADPNLATDQQKMAKVQVLQSLIPIGANPQVVLQRTLEVLEVPNYEEVMQPPPPPPPDPKVQQEQAKLQADMQRMQADMQIKAQELQAEMEIKTVELQMDREKHQMEMEKMRLEIQKIGAEIQKIKSTPVSKPNESN